MEGGGLLNERTGKSPCCADLLRANHSTGLLISFSPAISASTSDLSRTHAMDVEICEMTWTMVVDNDNGNEDEQRIEV